MAKIIIRCSAEHLQYEFPKRKWYQIRMYNRIAQMRLPFAPNDALACDILLEVYEDLMQETVRIVEDRYMESVYEAMFGCYASEYDDAEHLIVLDNGEAMPDMLYGLSNNRNYLSVITDNPDKYEAIAEHIEEEYGLVAMFFSSKKELLRYIKHMPEKKKAFLLGTGKASAEADDKGGRKEAREMASLLCSLPKGSFFMDLDTGGIYNSLILRKRLEITYASIPIFLDNIVKNRYNSVVNEGITIQVKNDKKQVWRRKGNEDGRKEKYPDI